MAVQKKVQSRQEIQVVGFYLGTDEYAININNVREIVAMMEIRKIPKAPPFVEGVIVLRGHVIPIIDLRKRFEMSAIADIQSAKILIVEFHSHQLGMIVDNVSEVFRLNQNQIEPAPPLFHGNVSSQYIQGVGKLEERIIVLLDVEKLLSGEERTQLASLKG
ncbi:MAG TPA: chemotaxis protein CheW [Candidatus Ozemobacteraceae bacterium]|nr:chemotaxis protein CheW [Candidatus Ozemobacteraceae bacterium]